ncbi:MAG: ABC transporter ATP-binding protein [Acetobacteraceae bacterium]|nr:ABC transporter ATP-binding protein [Acetobacteraceae bacterium]
MEVEQLVVAYGRARAVDAVSFAVATGEHLTLLGPSGCGKTTTLRAVAGLERPDSGRIAIAGKTVYDGAGRIDVPPEARGLSMVFQSYAIWPHMTVAENVAFPLRARRVSRTETRQAVGRALALVDLAEFADRPATRLSGGQQQRVALARAVAFGTGTVLFDEPLSNLDAQLRIQMRTELADLRRQLGFAAIYVTHDQDEAFSLSDRILLMRAGRIEQEGTPEEIYRAPRTRFAAAFLGVRNIVEAELRGCEARLADGSVLRVSGSDGACAVAFRPGAVVLGQGQPATIHRVAFAGDLLHVFLRSGPLEICAHAQPHPDLRPGAETRWSVAPDACRVLRE